MSFLAPVNDFLVGLLGPFGPLMAVGLLGVLMVLLSLPVVLARKRDRLRELKDPARAPSKDRVEALRRSSGKDKLEKYSNFLEPQNAEEYSAAALKLLRAGYRS